jgi:hypothetical protein
MEVCVGNIADWRMKDFGCSVMWSQIKVACIVMAPLWGSMMGNSASGGWKK